MPLHKSIIIDNNSKVLIWKIEESFEDLHKNIQLTSKNKQRLNGMKSDLHQRGFLAVRQLLKIAGYEDLEVIYDEFGKPHLSDGKFISITHSFIFCGIIVSDKPVGIDIEKRRDKIIKIAHKFTPIKEYESIAHSNDLVRKLTIVWGGKESLYKIYGKKKLHFLEHIYIKDFLFKTGKTSGQIQYKNKTATYQLFFFEIENFTCVYAL